MSQEKSEENHQAEMAKDIKESYAAHWLPLVGRNLKRMNGKESKKVQIRACQETTDAVLQKYPDAFRDRSEAYMKVRELSRNAMKDIYDNKVLS